MFNKKNLKKFYLLSIFVILLAFISAITFFLKNSNNKNYIAIIDFKLAKSIDHIFMESSANDFITDFTARHFGDVMPEYNWDVSTTRNIEVKMFVANKRLFYQKSLPDLQRFIKEKIPKLNQKILKRFTELYEEGMKQDILNEKKLTYWSMSKQPYYTGAIKTEVRFRKLQLTQIEFLSISLFLSLSALTIITAYYISRRKKI